MVLPELVIQALALAIRYLKEFGLERIICSGASFRPFLSKVEMTLSANTLQQLEVIFKSLVNFGGILFVLYKTSCYRALV